MGQKRGFKGAAVAGALGAGALAGAAGTAHAEENGCCQPDHYKCIACGQWNDVAIGGDHSATCGQCGSPNWVIGTAASRATFNVDNGFRRWGTDPNHNNTYDGSDYGGNDHGDGGGDGGGGGGGGGDGGGNGD